MGAGGITTTQLTIINKALVLCGAATVTSLTDGSTNANALNAVYKTVLQAVLFECKWNFATKRILLPTASTTTIPWYYDQESIVYSLPTAGVIRIYGVDPPIALWREENGYIISDTSGLGIIYVTDDETELDFPAYFLPAFIDRLCAEIAFVIMNSAKIATAFMEKYETISLPKAMSINSQTGIQQTPEDTEWTAAKFYNDANPDQPWGPVAT